MDQDNELVIIKPLLSLKVLQICTSKVKERLKLLKNALHKQKSSFFIEKKKV